MTADIIHAKSGGQRPPLHKFSFRSRRSETAATEFFIVPILCGNREGRGFSPAEIAAITRFLSRAPRSLRPQAARGAGPGGGRRSAPPQPAATARLLPRPPPSSRPQAARGAGHRKNQDGLVTAG